MSLSKTVRLAASVLGKHANGKGGRAVAASRSPEERREFARHAARVRWARLQQLAEPSSKEGIL